ncbi:MAG: Rab family GTPase [Gemmatimonadaceae bacterium]
MIQKKVCMVGVFGTGKTCLVQQYVHSIFAAKYHTTVGVKIDRKDVKSGNHDVRLMLWDLEGRDATRGVNSSYVRGAHGVLYVADGTRRETVDQLFDIRSHVVDAIGDVPSVIALNKVDLTDQWKLSAADETDLSAKGVHMIRTSAKTGEGVEQAFQWLTDSALAADGSTE